MVFLLFHIWTRTKVVELSYRSAGVQKSVQSLEAKLIRLQSERSRQRSGENLEAWVRRYSAKGLIFENPKPEQIHYFSTESL